MHRLWLALERQDTLLCQQKRACTRIYATLASSIQQDSPLAGIVGYRRNFAIVPTGIRIRQRIARPHLQYRIGYYFVHTGIPLGVSARCGGSRVVLLNNFR